MFKEAHRQKHQTLLLCFNCAISLIPFVHNCHSQVCVCVRVSQLAMFQRHVSPVHKTLSKFPMLFWALPVPFHMDMPSADWEGQLLTSCLFISLIQKHDPVRLEAALTAWFWSNTALLDVISTSKTQEQGVAAACSCYCVLVGPVSPALSPNLHRASNLRGSKNAECRGFSGEQCLT